MKKICVVGSINMDLVTHTNHLPKMGETIIGTGFATFPGGKGANQAIAAARLGMNVNMIACVGNDDFGKTLKDNLKRNNVSTNAVTTLTNTTSGIATIIIHKGDNFIILSGGANQKFTKDVIDKKIDMLKSCDIVILQNEIPNELNKYVMEICYKNGIKIIYNAAPAIKLDKNQFQYIDVLIVNEHECGYMLGTTINSITDAENATNLFLEHGIKNVIITMGKNGAVYNDGETSGCVKSINVTVVDTTGAGDTFCGAIATALAEDKTLKEAVEFANCAAAIAITADGAQSSMPNYDDVLMFQNRHNIK